MWVVDGMSRPQRPQLGDTTSTPSTSMGRWAHVRVNASQSRGASSSGSAQGPATASSGLDSLSALGAKTRRSAMIERQTSHDALSLSSCTAHILVTDGPQFLPRLLSRPRRPTDVGPARPNSGAPGECAGGDRVR